MLSRPPFWLAFRLLGAARWQAQQLAAFPLEHAAVEEGALMSRPAAIRHSSSAVASSAALLVAARQWAEQLYVALH